MRLIILLFLMLLGSDIFSSDFEDCNIKTDVKVIHTSKGSDGSIELKIQPLSDQYEVMWLSSSKPLRGMIITGINKGFYTALIYSQNGKCQTRIDNIEIR